MDNFRILIIDDVPVVSEGLLSIFKRVRGVETVAVCETRQAAIELVRAKTFDVIYTELHQAHTNGIILGQELLLINPRLKVVVYSRESGTALATEISRLGQHKRIQHWTALPSRCTSNEDNEAVNTSPKQSTANSTVTKSKLHNQGLYGYIQLKNITPVILEQQLLLLSQNRKMIDGEVLDTIEERYLRPALRPREIQCIELVGQALSNREIAEILGISQQGVENLINSLYNKFSIEGEPKDPGRRVRLALSIQNWYGQQRLVV